ncbi:MAG: pentapeptide repeat-containing protein [Pseudanabaenaceae cyanobacterium]
MALSFVGQDLRNRSFKGRRDLIGADFTRADLRGCDFRGADLTGANFTGAKTGKSRRQWMILIAFAFAGAFAFAVAVAGAVAGAFAGAFAGQAYTALVAGKTGLGIAYSFTSLILLYLAWYLLKQLIEIIKSATGTDFRGADLTGAKFVNAQLRVTDFTDANCNWVNWQDAEFYLCTLPKNIEDDKVRYLCRNPDKGRGQYYTSLDFRNTYLQNADLVDAVLRHANLNGADLRGAKLINADLSNSQALGTDFTGADFSGARVAHWGINPETNFENVICTHVYIDEARKERKPASGEFAEGDFALLVTKFTETLDFLFKNGIQPQAFDQALTEMLDQYGEFGIKLKAVEEVGDHDRLVRFTVQDPKADKGQIHADFENKYYGVVQQLEAAENQLQKLKQANTELSTKLAVAEAVNQEREKHSHFLRDFVYHQTDQFSRPSFIAPHSTFTGDPMSDQKQTNSPNIALQAGGNMTGITVAGGDISGTVTVTIQQLRDSDTPEAPQLADLLSQLQQAINESTELAAPDKEKALKYLDKIGKLANDQEPDRDVISMAIDGILGIVSKAAKLLAPVQGIADGLRKLLNL